jgi:predicted RNase H-like HicB family nuclease
MAERTITILIKEMVENNEKYYLAESPDVPNFFAEADTLEEIVNIAPEVMEMILKLDRKKESRSKNLFQKVVFDMNYTKKVASHLQLA